MIVNARKLMPHEEAIELLPWLINDSLSGDERDTVLDHARSCVICRRETKALENLRDSVKRVLSPAPIPAPDMRNINARIDALIHRQNLGRRWLSWIAGFCVSPWRIAFVAQTVLLVVLGTAVLWPTTRNAEFTMLTQSQDLADGHYLRVVFSPDLTHARLGALLDDLGLAIVDGPSERGVYTLATQNSMTVAKRDIALTHLSNHRSVLFAQPVDLGAAP